MKLTWTRQGSSAETRVVDDSTDAYARASPEILETSKWRSVGCVSSGTAIHLILMASCGVEDSCFNVSEMRKSPK